MDKIIQIFVKLGVDQSIFIQFAIFTVLFVLLKVLFFDKLLFVIQTREEKTTKLESEAGDKMKEAEKLAQQFEDEIQKTSETVYQKMHDKKAAAVKDINAAQKVEEDKILADFEAKKKEVISAVEESSQKILAQADELSETLVQKITN